MKTYIWKEKPIVNILSYVGMCIFINALIVYPFVFGPILQYGIGIDNNTVLGIGFCNFFASLIIGVILLSIGNKISDSKKFASKFIEEIKAELEIAKTLDEHLKINKKLWDEAVDKNNHIRLAHEIEIKKLIQEVYIKINILKKLS